MEENYCTNETCDYKYNCPIFHFLNGKVTSKFFLIKNDPENCKYYKRKSDGKDENEKNK